MYRKLVFAVACFGFGIQAFALPKSKFEESPRSDVQREIVIEAEDNTWVAKMSVKDQWLRNYWTQIIPVSREAASELDRLDASTAHTCDVSRGTIAPSYAEGGRFRYFVLDLKCR